MTPILVKTAPVFLAALLACGDSAGPGDEIEGVAQILSGLQIVAVSPGHQLTIRPALYDTAFNIIPYPSADIFEWTSAQPALVRVSRHGVITVAANAALNQRVSISACFKDRCDGLEVQTAPQPDSITLVPQGNPIVPGGRTNLTGIAWVGGVARSNYFYHFSASDTTILVVQKHGCGAVPECVINSPDVTESYPQKLGTVSVTATSQGLAATISMTVEPPGP